LFRLPLHLHELSVHLRLRRRDHLHRQLPRHL